MQILGTLHFKIKKLSTNSSKKYEGVLLIFNYHWFDSVLKRICFDFCHESAAVFSHYWEIDSSNSALTNVNDSVSQLWMGIQ